jgi:plasmid stabilization system protein ParE
VKALAKHPQSGRPVEELPPEFREWVIEFGHGAYVALYHYDGKQIVMLAVRRDSTGRPPVRRVHSSSEPA